MQEALTYAGCREYDLDAEQFVSPSYGVDVYKDTYCFELACINLHNDEITPNSRCLAPRLRSKLGATTRPRALRETGAYEDD